eukprot:4648954-Pyramimonas_sp.AAC.1
MFALIAQERAGDQEGTWGCRAAVLIAWVGVEVASLLPPLPHAHSPLERSALLRPQSRAAPANIG